MGAKGELIVYKAFQIVGAVNHCRAWLAVAFALRVCARERGFCNRRRQPINQD